MIEVSDRLRAFGRRVRLVRAWRGLAIGACFGAGVDTVWSILDWRGVAYTDWLSMSLVVGAGALIGALVGFFWKISPVALARSVDRRANLDDRIASALSLTGSEGGEFADNLRQDAAVKLEGIKPSQAYPIRAGRWHGGALALSALAAGIFLLGNTPLFLGADAAKDRAEMQKQGAKVEKINRETFGTPEAKQQLDEAQKRLSDELRKYQQDLERARMSKEESMQKANEIAKKAEDLAKQAEQQKQQSLEKAQSMMDHMKQQALDKAGMPQVSPSMAEMPDSQRQDMMRQTEQQMRQTQNQISDLLNKLQQLNQKLSNPNLSAEERKKLEEQREALQKEVKAAQKSLEDLKRQEELLKLSQEAQKIMDKMMKDPLYKQIQDLAQQMRDKMTASSKGGQQGQMTDEERKAMQKELEKLLAKLKDDKAMQQYLQEMLKALMQGGKQGQGEGVMLGMQSLFPMWGSGGPGDHEQMLFDMGKVNHSEKENPGKGNATPTMVTGSQRPTAAPQAYVEIKAPTTVGTRSGIPYVKVLPSYRKKAESAMERQQIPKEQEKRVKAYFESLGK